MQSDRILIPRNHATILVVVLGLMLGAVLAACMPSPLNSTPNNASEFTIVPPVSLIPESVTVLNASCGITCDPSKNQCGVGMICKTNNQTGVSTCEAPWCPSIVGYLPPACGMACGPDNPCAAGLGCAGDGICRKSDATCPYDDPLEQCFMPCDEPGAYEFGFYCIGDETSANWINDACTVGTSCWDPCVPVEAGGKGCNNGLSCEGSPSTGYMCNAATCVGCASPCKLDSDCSPLASDAACIQGQCRSTSVCTQPGAGPSPTPPGIVCGNAGGIEFLGDICICPGIMDTVIICKNGEKFDNPHPEQSCVPTEDCSQSGGTTGGDSGGTTGGGNACDGSCGNGTCDAACGETADTCIPDCYKP